MLRNCLILLLLMLSLGMQNTSKALPMPISNANEFDETITLPEQSVIHWEDLGLCNALSVTSTSISAPSTSLRVVHRPHHSGNAPRTNHSAIDDLLSLLSYFEINPQHSISLALPTRSVDYYIYSLNRLRC